MSDVPGGFGWGPGRSRRAGLWLALLTLLPQLEIMAEAADRHAFVDADGTARLGAFSALAGSSAESG
jgi:hypothetical protein